MEQIKVDFSKWVGAIKPLNAVNNGPKPDEKEQTSGNFADFKRARIPYARTHDSAFCPDYGGPHIVDISSIFPDFDADPTLPESYDFDLTDDFLQAIIDAGTQVFFRLGESIEHARKKYHIYPPKEFKKWAVICEHIIRHYNEGWADGFHHNIVYWEIWNEPNLHIENNSPTWGGTTAQFFDFYETAAKHLKACFPHLKIGGPALARGREWGEEFLAEMKKRDVPLDFFSWHRYTSSTEVFMERVEYTRRVLDEAGYTEAESILNEWAYIKGWTDDFVYSLKAINGIKGASYVTAIMAACQYAPLDMLMYYDARPRTAFNGLFDQITQKPQKTYYALYAFSDLAELGESVAVENCKDVYCVAATNGSRHGMLLTYYNDDDRAPRKTLHLAWDGMTEKSKVTVYRTDSESDMIPTLEMVVNGPDVELCLDMKLFDVYYVDITPIA